MKTIMDLPDEVLERIFTNLVKINLTSSMWLPIAIYEHVKQQEVAKRIRLISEMRLVCRKWAEWFYQRHLYDQLSFKCSSRATAFINELARRPKTLPPPQCRYLKVQELWTWGLVLVAPPGKAEFKNLDALIDQFSETIVALEIQAVNLFTLPISTIERIGRIPNLRSLRLGIHLTRVGGGKTKSGSSVHRDLMIDGLPTDSECLVSLLRAAQGVVSLDLTNFRPICSPSSLGEDLHGHQFTSITTLKLDVKNEGDPTLDGIVRLATRLPNLKVLWIGGPGHMGDDLIPLFEVLRERLEELFVTDARVIRHALNLNFPRLRVIRVHEWDREFEQFLPQPMFASVEILALNCYPFHKRKKKASLWVPFETLPHLRRLELHEASEFPPPRSIEARCEDHGVECVYACHDIFEEDGRPNLDFDAPSALMNQLRI
ncbi:hypothetical protein PGT21_013285 [Puccinia graminis f. sp. tritici]|uniref:F-box domain-containing protein n=2 Tax=Puccinia graminis f. sp. tritici TaxID=56615 RepID=E3KLR0_PUCGT|nr:uncharacterized protein PGTG_11428 [Puccinia graminis f. sp. tritici CRL 75-36-700-3]EFP85259.1 hypothetical protein PGTG_11428 [Puccinia graminis f. sp. tritici CRL 75-36-700-3]KAA1111830.1 hypothetical protein PGT21_013285 [Puccinia graminis f. sp. tritici]